MFARRNVSHVTNDITNWRIFKWRIRIFKMADFQNGGFSKWRISKMEDLLAGKPGK
jgi:hypothetical protein